MSFRYSMTWLHTWSGLLLGWILYFMFLTGATGYFDIEIDRWMRPEIPVMTAPFDVPARLPDAEAYLRNTAPNATQYYIEFPFGRSPVFSLWWHNPDNIGGSERKGWHHELLDPNSGEKVSTRDTAGGEFLYRLHYVLHYIPRSLAYWITSLAAMFMLVAIISGIIIHKRIFKDFFTLRRKKPQRFWLDTHNLFSVLPLPFHIMITYSGLMLLMLSTLPAVPVSIYGTDEEKLRAVYDSIFSEATHREPAGIAAESAPLMISYQKALADSQQENLQGDVAFISIDYPGDQSALVGIGLVAEKGIEPFAHLHYDAITAERHDPADEANEPSTGKAFYELMEHLHEGLFAQPWLRWVYFLSSLMGAGMVASGSILWAVKRREKHSRKSQPNTGLKLVECLNIGTIAGLTIAIAGYFWANRLLPAELETRATWEMHSLFIVWLLALIHPFLAGHTKTSRQLWAEQFTVAALAYGLIPVINLMTTENHLGISLRYGDWVLAGFDLFMLALSVCFACLAFRIGFRIESKKRVTAGCC